MSSLVRKLLFLLLPLLTVSHLSFSKEGSSLRKLLNRVHVSTSIGYGLTNYCHQVGSISANDVIFFKEGDQFYIHNPKEKGIVYLVQWFDDSYVRMKSYTDLTKIPADKRAIGKIKLKGTGSTLPLSLSTYVDLWKKFRVGVGGTLFIDRIDRLETEEEAHQGLSPYTFSPKNRYRLRPFGILGYKFIENTTLSVLLDVNIGLDFIYASLSERALDYFRAGTQSVGLTMEGHISEYFRIFGRTSYEVRSTMDRFEIKNQAYPTIAILQQTSFLFQVGVSFNCPEIPRCPVSCCRIERKHKHKGESYRGVSMFTGKDSRKRKLFEK